MRVLTIGSTPPPPPLLPIAPQVIGSPPPPTHCFPPARRADGVPLLRHGATPVYIAACRQGRVALTLAGRGVLAPVSLSVSAAECGGDYLR